MRTAVTKLERRIADLQVLDPNAVSQRPDPAFKAVELKVEDTLAQIFGNDTVEHDRFQIGYLDTAPHVMGGGIPLSQIREGYRYGVERAVTKLQTAVELLKENLADLGESPEGRAVQAFAGLDIHPEIERAAGELLRGGHCANAIEDACKALDAMVKQRSGRSDLSGTSLMQTVFSPNSPVLRFNQLTSTTDKDEQQGMMFLYAGAMLAFRNPRAHELVKDHPETAVEILSFISFLAKALEKTTRTS
jgi:uncharacterized protein (TIGR02391 family)